MFAKVRCAPLVGLRRLAGANLWPVAQRELREGARRPINHRLRFLSAGVGTLLFYLLAANSEKSSVQMGGWLLGGFHTLMLGLIFLVVPALTADSIAKEKRDGTLGLLFLTPLSAGGIVLGKSLALALRAFTLWLALVPLLSIPFLTGGVTWFDAMSALSLEFCAAILCLAAGLLASSLARQRNTAFVLAYLLSAVFLLIASEFFGLIPMIGWRGFGVLQNEGWFEIITLGMILCSGWVGNFRGWSSLSNFSTILSDIWLRLCLAGPPVALLFFFLVSRFAAARLEHSWQDQIPSARREGFLRRYCSPLWRGRFQRKMQRTLDWNPIAWLQQYSWKARLSKWTLCLGFLVVIFAFQPAPRAFEDISQLTFVGIYTFVAINGFLEEKRSGALELLLVTPLSAGAIIFGRTWGLWKQFLPTAVVLFSWCVIGLWGNDFHDLTDEGMFALAGVVCGFLTLPVFATYFALRVKNLLVASALTWIAVGLPSMFALSAGSAFFDNEIFPEQLQFILNFPMIILFNLGFALLACFLLRHSLSRRIYAF